MQYDRLSQQQLGFLILQDRLLTLEQTLDRTLGRSYKAHLFEDSDEMQRGSLLYLDSEDSGLGSLNMMQVGSDMERLYEDPEYLKQYVVYWADGDGNTVTAEYGAYLNFENETYLRKV